MEYNDILKQVEAQNKEKSLAGKMFRYSGLIMAVDYFSQKLNSDQIMEAAFDFANELLTLESSSLFYIKDGSYKLVREKGKGTGIKNIKKSKKLSDLAVFHGNILSGKNSILKYFDDEIYKNCNIEIIIPITVDAELEGFIIIPEKSSGMFDEDDIIICEVLMNLYNSALRNYEIYNELQSINMSLDEKIFNLFAINQSSKALLSQLDLDALYNLSIDVFSELTQSSSTGFILYDEKSERYVMRSYRFVFDTAKSLAVSLEMRDKTTVDPNRIIIDMANDSDKKYFNSIFKDGTDMLAGLEPKYVILLNKDGHVLGFVTLGTTVTGTAYKKNVFELIESLASATYIAISNAKHFRQVEEQKKIIQSKLDRLISLNTLVRNINSSLDIEALLEVTMKTLSISFLTEKGLIALYDSDNSLFAIKNSYGINDISDIKQNKYWNRVLKGKSALVFGDDELDNYFGNRAVKIFGDITGALIVPIYLDRADIEILGVIIVFDFFDSLISDEENVLTIETISGHIAPILSSLNLIEEQKTMLIPDYSEIFIRDLKEEICQAREYSLDLLVIKVSHQDSFSFSYPDLAGGLKKRFSKVYPVSYDTVFVISNNRDDDDIDSIIRSAGVNNVSVDTYLLREDFNDLQEFLTETCLSSPQ